MDLTLATWLLNAGPTGILLVVAWAFATGKIHTTSEMQQINRSNAEAVARLDQRVKDLMAEHERELAAVRADAEARIKSLERDRDFFRDLSVRSLQGAGRSLEVADRALSRAESSGSER